MSDPAPKLRAGKPRASRAFFLVSGILAAQILLFYVAPTSEYVPAARPLAEFPRQLGPWAAIRDGVVESEVQELLKADDTLNRTYAEAANGHVANLFVAFFKSQRAGVSPHSPKVCLPGSGWTPLDSRRIQLSIPGRPTPITVNRYTVARGENRSVVIYWYQTLHRIIANEYLAKLYLMADGVRYRRSDTSLVRVIVPVVNQDEDLAQQQAIEFVQKFLGPLSRHLPG